MYIAIPSYRRAKTIGSKTLRVLKQEGFLASSIDIFVADTQEEAIYRATVDRTLYNEIIVGVPKIYKQRKFISDYYPPGSYVVQLDDDIRGFKKLREVHLPTLFLQAFDYCKEHTIPLWGIYPVANDLFMKDSVRLGLFLVCGICFGSVAGTLPEIGIDFKDDWYLSLTLYQEFGTLMRIEYIAPHTTYWGSEGGLNTYRTLELEEEVSQILLSLFPEYIDTAYIKKNGHPDIKLKKFPSRQIVL
jgi:hypothetical protein